MHLFYADETNTDPETSDFFVYAGVVIPPSTAGALAAKIDEIRAKHGYKPGDALKFTVAKNDRPAHITSQAHAAAKQAVLEAARDADVRLLATITHHDIVKGNVDRARTYGINQLCYHFDCYLAGPEVQGHGLVLIDRFDDKVLNPILVEKFSVGLEGLPYSSPYKLKRVVGFHQAFINTSHFCSVVDLALGALRWSVNNRKDATKAEKVQQLAGLVSPLFLRSAEHVRAISLFFSPASVRVPHLHAEYVALSDWLKGQGIDPQHLPEQG